MLQFVLNKACFCLSVYQYLCPFVCQSACSSISLSVCSFISLSVCSSISLSVCTLSLEHVVLELIEFKFVRLKTPPPQKNT